VIAASIAGGARGHETVEQTLTTIRAFSVGEGAP